MRSKLTLTLSNSVIERAKVYAKNTGRSLSELVENYLESISSLDTTTKISPKLKRIAGAVKLPDDFKEEMELDRNYSAKHL